MLDPHLWIALFEVICLKISMHTWGQCDFCKRNAWKWPQRHLRFRFQLKAVYLNFIFIKESWKNAWRFQQQSEATVFNTDNNQKCLFSVNPDFWRIMWHWRLE